MMVSSVGDQSVCLDNSGADQPLTDVKSIELQMECDAIGITNVALCIYGTAQFKLDYTRVWQLHGSTRF